MKIRLKNIGKVTSADVEINGISIIAGENDTGKSTVGKSLYCIFNGMHDLANAIRAERADSISEIFYSGILRGSVSASSLRDMIFDIVPEIASGIVSEKETYLENRDALAKKISESFRDSENIQADVLDNLVDSILELLAVEDFDVEKEYLNRIFRKMFNGSIQNIFKADDSGCIELNIRNEKTDIVFKNNNIASISGIRDLLTGAIYIDDPFVLDEVGSDRITKKASDKNLNYKSMLIRKLSAENDRNIVESVVINEKISHIADKISAVCSGVLKVSHMQTYYSFGNENKEIPMKDVSMGLKTFIILKTLLMNGSIEEKGFVILDEPEIHLHPAWQILFAEILVMMQKQFNLHILINTHSPYFMRAIEVYSEKHGVSEKCRYYLAENIDEHYSEIRNVTDNRELIYEKLADPLQVLEDETAKFDGY